MRIKLLLLLASVCLLQVECQSSMDELLMTNQYLLIAQEQCLTQFESDVPDGKCPHVLQKPPKLSDQCQSESVRTHLLRDPAGLRAPKLVMLAHDKRYRWVKLRFLNLNSTIVGFGTNDPKARKVNTIEQRLDGDHIFYEQIPNDVDSEYFTLYDTMSQVLYIIFQTTSNDKKVMQKVKMLYFKNIFSDKKNEGISIRQMFFRASGSTIAAADEANMARTEWTEDPYTQQVYYKEQNGDASALYVFPSSRILSVLLEGVAGKLVKIVSNGNMQLSINGGLNSTKEFTEKNKMKIVTSRFTPTDHTLKNLYMQCSYNTTENYTPSFGKLIVVRDFDYCLLKYGPEASITKCHEERLNWLVSKGIVDEDSGDTVLWLFIVIIALVTLIALLFVYIYWLRSTFATVEDERAAHANEYEQEASLFLSKQRSFPSAYPDPGLMDVSVDKWA